jgi:hypothetical protein
VQLQEPGMFWTRWTRGLLGTVLLGVVVGCGGPASNSKPDKPVARSQKPKPTTPNEAEPEQDFADEQEDASAKPNESKSRRPSPRYAPIDLAADLAPADKSVELSPSEMADRQAACVIAALNPMQVLLGQWRWTTQRGNVEVRTDELDWVWDFRTDAQQPALVFTAAKHPYFRTGRLTFLSPQSLYQLSTGDESGAERVFEGTWAEGGEPGEFSEGKVLHRTFKLTMEQVSPAEGEQWSVTLSQTDNNDYRMEIRRRAASATRFQPFDIVRQQRMGTSFAVADSDNPGPKCIISGGLGTMTVTYKGRSYPVCCSGCAAAFNDDPEKWLAKLAANGTIPEGAATPPGEKRPEEKMPNKPRSP